MAQQASGTTMRAGQGVPLSNAGQPASNLRLRVYSAILGAPFVIFMAWASVPTTAALASAASVVALYEFHRMTVRAGSTPIFLLGLTGAVLLVVEAVVDFDFLGALITGAVLVPLFLMLLTPPRERFLADWAWTLAGVFLVGWTLRHAVLIRKLDEGREWLLTAIILTFAIDMGAYAFGRLIGKHPLAPTVSPKKTWEGSLGGMAVAISTAVMTTQGFDLDISVGEAIGLGALVGLFSQAGDLAISMIKRTAGVKDASSLIPGHGGLLDRLDSLIPAIVVLYYFLILGLDAL